MNLFLMEMLKGKTPLEMLANFSKHLELLTFHRPSTVQLYGRIEAIAEDGITLTKPELVFLSEA